MNDLVIALELTDEQKEQFNTPEIESAIEKCKEEGKNYSFLSQVFFCEDGEHLAQFRFFSGNAVDNLFSTWILSVKQQIKGD